MPESGANYSGTLYQQLAGEDFSVSVTETVKDVSNLFRTPRL